MYCILVAGMPASGKSTIAVRISESLGIPMLSKDSIKEVLFDDLGFHTELREKEFIELYEDAMYHQSKTGTRVKRQNKFPKRKKATIDNVSDG